MLLLPYRSVTEAIEGEEGGEEPSQHPPQQYDALSEVNAIQRGDLCTTPSSSIAALYRNLVHATKEVFRMESCISSFCHQQLAVTTPQPSSSLALMKELCERYDVLQGAKNELQLSTIQLHAGELEASRKRGGKAVRVLTQLCRAYRGGALQTLETDGGVLGPSSQSTALQAFVLLPIALYNLACVTDLCARRKAAREPNTHGNPERREARSLFFQSYELAEEFYGPSHDLVRELHKSFGEERLERWKEGQRRSGSMRSAAVLSSSSGSSYSKVFIPSPLPPAPPTLPSAYYNIANSIAAGLQGQSAQQRKPPHHLPPPPPMPLVAAAGAPAAAESSGNPTNLPMDPNTMSTLGSSKLQLLGGFSPFTDSHIRLAPPPIRSAAAATGSVASASSSSNIFLRGSQASHRSASNQHHHHHHHAGAGPPHAIAAGGTVDSFNSTADSTPSKRKAFNRRHLSLSQSQVSSLRSCHRLARPDDALDLAGPTPEFIPPNPVQEAQEREVKEMKQQRRRERRIRTFLPEEAERKQKKAAEKQQRREKRERHEKKKAILAQRKAQEALQAAVDGARLRDSGGEDEEDDDGVKMTDREGDQAGDSSASPPLLVDTSSSPQQLQQGGWVDGEGLGSEGEEPYRELVTPEGREQSDATPPPKRQAGGNAAADEQQKGGKKAKKYSQDDASADDVEAARRGGGGAQRLSAWEGSPSVFIHGQLPSISADGSSREDSHGLSHPKLHSDDDMEDDGADLSSLSASLPASSSTDEPSSEDDEDEEEETVEERKARYEVEMQIYYLGTYRRRVKAAIRIQCAWRSSVARLKLYNLRQLLYFTHYRRQKAAALCITYYMRSRLDHAALQHRLRLQFKGDVRRAVEERREVQAVRVLEQFFLRSLQQKRERTAMMKTMRIHNAKWLHAYSIAALIIQRWWPLVRQERQYWLQRGEEVREEARAIAEAARREKAATSIQALVRGVQERKALRILQAKRRREIMDLQQQLNSCTSLVRLVLTEYVEREAKAEARAKRIEDQQRDAADVIAGGWANALARRRFQMALSCARSLRLAASRVQRWWRRFYAARERRYLREMNATAERDRIDEEFRIYRATLRLQCFARVVLAKAAMRRQRARYGRGVLHAMGVLQSVGRGCLQRRALLVHREEVRQAAEEAAQQAAVTQRRQAAAVAAWIEAKRTAVLVEQRRCARLTEKLYIRRLVRQELREEKSAIRIQRTWRRYYKLREDFRVHYEMRCAEAKVLMAVVKLQCFWRQCMAKEALRYRKGLLAKRIVKRLEAEDRQGAQWVNDIQYFLIEFDCGYRRLTNLEEDVRQNMALRFHNTLRVLRGELVDESEGEQEPLNVTAAVEAYYKEDYLSTWGHVYDDDDDE